MRNEEIISMLKELQRRCQRTIERHKHKIKHLKNLNLSNAGSWDLGYFEGAESTNDNVIDKLQEIIDKIENN